MNSNRPTRHSFMHSYRRVYILSIDGATQPAGWGLRDAGCLCKEATEASQLQRRRELASRESSEPSVVSSRPSLTLLVGYSGSPSL